MKNKKENKKAGLLVLSLFFLLVPLIIWALYLYIYTGFPGADWSEILVRHLSYFPGFIQSQLRVSMVVFFFSLLSIIFSVKSLKNASSVYRLPGILLILLAVILIILQIFTLFQ